MNGKKVRNLAVIAAALILAILVMQRTEHGVTGQPGRLLLPGFASQANDARRVSIDRADADTLLIQRDADHWVVAARDDYPADIGKLRQLFIGLAEARIVEEKTSNPELYEKLGVGDPGNGGSGTRVSVAGEGFDYSVIFGKTAQGNRRYVRPANDARSYLVDRSPELPKDVSGWLAPEILDIASTRLRSIAIVHDDGETIRIQKSAEDQDDFAVLDIPQGRELSYPTVANGIAGGLSALKLDDVRKAADGPVSTTAVFETWKGLRITIAISDDDSKSWLAFVAEKAQPEAETGDEVEAINQRVSGWQYRVADYKLNMLTKRWKDILKASQ